MRRVIYAWDYTDWGGAQIHFLALIKIVRQEFDTLVVLPEGTDRQFLGFLDAQMIEYTQFPIYPELNARSGIVRKIGRHWIKIKNEYRMLSKLNDIGLEDSIVHTDLLPTQSLLSLVWLCLRTDVFITSHNAMPPVPRWRKLLCRIKFRTISLFDTFHVFCSNKDAARYFRGLYSKKISDEIRITYDSIDPVEIDQALAL